jgi:hypothetical protein
MGNFSAGWVEFFGELTVSLPVEQTFELFSPLGERQWVNDWTPELLHPPDISWERGQIFRTCEERGEAIWVVTALDRKAHEVEYHRVETGRYVARVFVRCTPVAAQETQVATSYKFVGLSVEGNAEITRMTPDAYREKMQRWERWIGEHVARRP